MSNVWQRSTMLKCLAAHWYNLKLKQRYEKKQ